MGQVTHQSRAYLSFCSMKQLGVYPHPPPPPLDGMLVHRRVTPSIKFASSHSYTWAGRGTVRVSCARTQQCHRPGLEPRMLDPETSILTVMPPCFPWYRASHTTAAPMENVNIVHVILYCGRQNVLVACVPQIAWVQSPGRIHQCFVFLGKTLNSHITTLYPGV